MKNLTGKADIAARIGRRIKSLREEVGLTAKELAQSAGISGAFLSRVENGATMPSVPTLNALAEALKVDIGSIFEQPEKRRFTISRKNDRRKVYSFRGEDQKAHYLVEPLSENMPDPLMEPVLVTALTTDIDELNLATHSGQEFCMVMMGRIEIVLGSQSFILETGDSVYFDGRIPHGAISRSNEPAKTLNVHIIPGQRTGSFHSYGVNPELIVDDNGHE